LLRFLSAGCLIFLFFFPGCTVSDPVLYPLPEQINGIEGYSSLKVTASGETARSRFSFVFGFPGLGHIVVTDFMGRSLFQIYFEGGDAYVVVHSKECYWQGNESDAMEMLLGFDMRVFDLVGMITGRLEGSQTSSAGPDVGWTWELHRDRRGRIDMATSDDLCFKVEEFYGRSSYVRILAFTHPHFEGRIRVLRLGFNPKLTESAFNRDFLHKYERVTWEALQRTIRDED
jgi:hypothetical protein